MGDVNKSLAKWIDKLGVESRCETEIMDILQSDNISDKELGIFYRNLFNWVSLQETGPTVDEVARMLEAKFIAEFKCSIEEAHRILSPFLAGYYEFIMNVVPNCNDVVLDNTNIPRGPLQHIIIQKFLVTCSEAGAPDNVRDVFTSRYIEFAKKLRKDLDNWEYELAIFFAMHGGLAFGVDKRKAFDEIVAKAQEMSSF